MSTLRTTFAIALSIALGLSFAVTAAGCVANVGGPPGGDDGDDDGAPIEEFDLDFVPVMVDLERADPPAGVAFIPVAGPGD
ncbi:MAG: hypothetical protein K8M05_20740, partial [Deltaproteobacteria bacterium]|nr:hypothetical protein [Kofleriaceae bacterium]